MNKRIFISSLVALLIIGLLAGIYFYKSLTQRPVLLVFTAARKNISGTIRLYGKVSPENSADLGFELGGKIAALNHKVGDYINAGDVLVRSNDADLRAQYVQAVALRDAAGNYLEQYKELVDKDNYKWKSLKETSSANANDKKSQKEQVKADKALVEYQNNQLKAAQAGISIAAAKLDKAIIRAPFNGIITKQDSEVGEVFAAGEPVLTLINNKTLKIEVWASELEVKNLAVGNEAQVILDNDQSQTYGAKIDTIDPSVTLLNNISAYKVTLYFADKNIQITPGTDIQVRIVNQKKDNVIVIPPKAILSDNGNSFVYILQNNKKEKKDVQIGVYSVENSQVEIISGISTGDKIILPN